MRYRDLLEQTNSSITDIHKLIETKGQPWLKATNWYLPMSGRQKHTEDYYLGRYRSDRSSLAGENDIQTFIDNKVKSMGGKALRSNSIFVTTSYNTANKYGIPYFIFPLGDFHYHWYPDASDLIDYHVSIFTLMNKEELSRRGISDNLLNFVTSYYTDKKRLSLSDIKTAIEDSEELSLRTKKQYNHEYDMILNTLKKENIKINIDTGLDKWVNTNHELAINSSNGYMAIRDSYFIENLLDKYDWNEKTKKIVSYIK